MTEAAFNLGTVIEDAKKVITNPVGFYREMPTEGGFTNPLIFVVVMAAITGLLMTLFAIVGFGGANATVAGGMAMGAIIVFPIMATIGSFIGAGILFVVWKLMGSEKDYETAYRCMAYSFAIAPIVMLLTIIPYIATAIRVLWSSFLMYTASVEVHKIKAETAKIVFGILAALFLWMGISAEHTSRNIQNRWENAAKEFEENLPASVKNLEDMTAEEAGKKVGEFLKGLEEAAKEAEKAAKED